MSARAVVKRLLPPIVWDGLRALRDAGQPPEYERVPAGWAGAQSHAGWNVEAVARAQRERLPRFLECIAGPGPLGVAHESAAITRDDLAAHNIVMSYGYVAALAARGRDRLSVLDWGGGIGHYYALTRALLPGVALDYCCKDLPLLCEAGHACFPEARFMEDEAQALGRSYDLVVASSSLQYSEDWRGVAAKLAAAAGSLLFVTRLPIVHHAPSFVVLQRAARHGYDTEYLGWALNRRELLDHMTSLDLNLEREFLIHEPSRVRGAPEAPEQRGFLFRPAAARGSR